MKVGEGDFFLDGGHRIYTLLMVKMMYTVRQDTPKQGSNKNGRDTESMFCCFFEEKKVESRE